MSKGAGVFRGARLLVLSGLLAPAGAAPVQSTPAERARELRLWEEPAWNRLLHYKPARFFGPPHSDALPGPFFLTARGHVDPEGELLALARVLDDDSRDPDPPLGDSDGPEPVRCRYPARVRWLAGRLGREAEPLLAPCRRFAYWAGLMRAEGVAMVFASAYLNNPSSMFGHTFLRIEKGGTGADRRILDNSLNFAAETPDTSGFLFAFKGLTGLYPGKYTASPYYMKVAEYGSIEFRDLWEYRLAFSSAEVRSLVEHAWEVGRAVFPYYFFTRNCSYQLMPLLEAAAPRLTLMPRVPPVVGPIDTILNTVEASGLLKGVVYRPSHATILRERRLDLNRAERAAARAYADGHPERGDMLSESMPPGRKGRVLDAAQDLVLYRTGFHPDPPPAVRSIERPILLRRGRLEAESWTPPRPRWAAPPEEGHLRRRLLIGAGVRRGGPFAELGWRPGLHAFEDRSRGYLPGNAIEAFSWRLRYDAPTGKVHLNDLKVVEILSLTAYDDWTRKPSWGLGTGLETAFETGRDPDEALIVHGHFESGLAAGDGPGRSVGAVLAALEGAAGPVLRRGGRIGGGLRLEAGVDAGPLRAVVRGGLSGYFFGDRRPNHRLSAVLNWALGRDRSVRARFLMRGSHREGLLEAVLHH